MKYLKVTNQLLQESLLKFQDELLKGKIPDTVTVHINSSFTTKPEEKAHVCFTSDAWNKMLGLVMTCEKEIGWYGLVDREGNNFTISEIMVCPQTVTGSTVQTDDELFVHWHEEMFDKYGEDYLLKRRFYGHSHVNFSTNPSGVDDKHHEDLISTTPDFYLFGIFNKKGEFWFNIFDIENNVLFEKSDIVLDNLIGDTEWAKAQISEKVTMYEYKNKKTSANKNSSVPAVSSCKGKDYHRNYYDNYYDDYDYYGNYYNRYSQWGGKR